MTRPSLTGDPITDALVPVVSRLVGAVHELDPAGVDRAITDAEQVLTRALREVDQLRAARALAVVAAAMVPVDQPAGALLAWWPRHVECQRLIKRGIDPGIALQLTDPRDVS